MDGLTVAEAERYKQCVKHGKQAKTWSKFFQNFSADYHWLYAHGLLDKFYNDTKMYNRMIQNKISSDDIKLTDVLKIASKYPSYVEFIKNEPQLKRYIKKFGWRADIHELCFPEEEPTDLDWEIDEKI